MIDNTTDTRKTNVDLLYRSIEIDSCCMEKFENTALFQWLGLYILARHENEAFRKRSSNRVNLKNAGFSSVFVRTEYISKTELLENGDVKITK